MNNKTHILAACMANYVIPVTIIAGCYYSIVQAVFKHEEELRAQAKKMNVASLRSNSDQQQVSAEIRIAKVSIMNVSLWLTAWTPFAVICMLGTWGDVSKITPWISALPVLLAKTSCVYNPLIYALSHPKYREVFLSLIKFTKFNELSNKYFIFAVPKGGPPLDVHRSREDSSHLRQQVICQ